MSRDKKILTTYYTVTTPFLGQVRYRYVTMTFLTPYLPYLRDEVNLFLKTPRYALR